MEKTLDAFAIGENGVVKSVAGEGKIKRRLFRSEERRVGKECTS